MRKSTFLFLMAFLVISAQGQAREEVVSPTALMSVNETEIENITETNWRNYAYRDLAVSMAFNGDIDGGIALIDKIDNPDTQAMTIRGIGMALAIHKDLAVAGYKSLFQKLDNKAEIITDEGAKDIAYTYIAMAQAFAELDEDATITTQNMSNDALKHKAYGETAEIQAERGDYDAALKSINAITSVAFKNKALSTVSGLFVDQKKYESALRMAQQITNPAKKVSSIQKIINAQLGLEKID